MKKWFFLFIYSMLCVYSNAQQPPARLPSLIDNLDPKIPVLHKEENPEDIIRKKIFVKLEPSSRSVYAGESFLVTYKLYTALNSQARISRQPLFSGCSVLELSAPEEPQEETIDGIKWQVFTIRKIQVTALQEGTLTLDKVYVDNVVQLLQEENLEIENFSTQISNEPVTIEVKPLPAQGKPGKFTGMVGDYGIRVTVDSNNIPVGENATLKIVVSGTGNIAGIRMPYVDWPASTEHFDGTDTQYVNQDDFPVHGSKTFEIPFIGSKEGMIEIKPIQFSFFDPAAKTYRTVSSDSIPVTFSKALSRADQLPAIVTEDVSNKKYLWIVGAIALCVVAVWSLSGWWKKRKTVQQQEAQREPLPDTKTAGKATVTTTDAAEIFNALNHLGTLEDQQVFLTETKALLGKVIMEKTGNFYGSEEALLEGLRANKQYAWLYDDCGKILAACNRNLYSPQPDDDIKEGIYFETTAVIKQLYNPQSVNL